jgi:hypothetical protein
MIQNFVGKSKERLIPAIRQSENLSRLDWEVGAASFFRLFQIKAPTAKVTLASREGQLQRQRLV